MKRLHRYTEFIKESSRVSTYSIYYNPISMADDSKKKLVETGVLHKDTFKVIKDRAKKMKVSEEDFEIFKESLNEELRLDNSKPKVGDKITDGSAGVSGVITRLDDKGVVYVDMGDGMELSYYLMHIKKRNGEWIAESNKFIDKIQNALDVAGFEPTIGTFADGANAIISGLRAALAKEDDEKKKHLINAGISAASMIPGGDVAKLAKLRKGTKAAKVVNKGAKSIKKATELERKKGNRFNEELRQTEIDDILDKISAGTATEIDKDKLKNWDGIIDNSPQDKVEIDSSGDLRINNQRANPYNISDEFYDEGQPTEERDVTPELESEIFHFLDEAYFRSGHIIVNAQTEESVQEPKEIQQRLQHEFGIPLEDAQRIVFNWYKGVRD
jgi:hypothetical protein